MFEGPKRCFSMRLMRACIVAFVGFSSFVALNISLPQCHRSGPRIAPQSTPVNKRIPVRLKPAKASNPGNDRVVDIFQHSDFKRGKQAA
jgi:hypothetical protein